jgi:ketosteroid isomerase-like protein
MSRENVEIVVGVFESVNARDFAAALEVYAPNVILAFHDEEFAGDDAAGKEAVTKWFGDWFRNFDSDYRFEIEDALDLGERVFLVVTHHGRGRVSGAPITRRTGWIYTVEDGKVVRLDGYLDPADALEAVGLRQ